MELCSLSELSKGELGAQKDRAGWISYDTVREERAADRESSGELLGVLPKYSAV